VDNGKHRTTDPVSVALVGLGPIGRRIAAAAEAKDSLRVVGAVDIAPDIVGRPLLELIGRAGSDDDGITVQGSVDELLCSCDPQVVLHATGSSLRQVCAQFEPLLAAGVNVITTCEEAAFPYGAEAESLAERLDGLCKRAGCRLLGTGVNPGFAMDMWPLLTSATHISWKQIEVHRTVDAATRREPLQRKVGAGLSVDQFERQVREKRIGHVGLEASARMLVKGLGGQVAALESSICPVVAEQEVVSEYYRVARGEVAGLRQDLVCEVTGGRSLVLRLEMYLGAPDPRDEVTIEGARRTKVTVHGGFAGDAATAAIVVNAVRPLLTTVPGYHTMLDLPIFGCAP